MQIHQVGQASQLEKLITDLNAQLRLISIRLGKLEGNAGQAVSLNNDLNLNGHNILNQGT